MGVVFNTEGRVSKLNVGAVMDRTSGNTGGLGGLFGFLWFVGKSPPAPEYQPYKPSWQFALLNKVGTLILTRTLTRARARTRARRTRTRTRTRWAISSTNRVNRNCGLPEVLEMSASR